MGLLGIPYSSDVQPLKFMCSSELLSLHIHYAHLDRCKKLPKSVIILVFVAFIVYLYVYFLIDSWKHGVKGIPMTREEIAMVEERYFDTEDASRGLFRQCK